MCQLLAEDPWMARYISARAFTALANRNATATVAFPYAASRVPRAMVAIPCDSPCMPASHGSFGVLVGVVSFTQQTPEQCTFRASPATTRQRRWQRCELAKPESWWSWLPVWRP